MTMKKILLVEDYMDIQHVIEEILTHLSSNKDVKIIKSSSGKKALKLLEKEKDFNLILMDIMMPGMDGIEVSKIIRKNQSLKNIPIVFLTAKTESEVKIEAQKYGDAFIEKPFEIDTLKTVIKKFVSA